MDFDGSFPDGNLENGGTVNGDLQINGDINISGTLTASTFIIVDQLEVKDNIIQMGLGNPADSLNTGFFLPFKQRKLVFNRECHTKTYDC